MIDHRARPHDKTSEGIRVALFAPNERLRKAQRALLGAYGHRIVACGSFEELLVLDRSRADCISIDLHDLELTATECVRRFRQAGCSLPLILLSDHLPQAARGGPARLTTQTSDPTFLLFQPMDVELYLATIASLHPGSDRRG